MCVYRYTGATARVLVRVQACTKLNSFIMIIVTIRHVWMQRTEYEFAEANDVRRTFYTRPRVVFSSNDYKHVHYVVASNEAHRLEIERYLPQGHGRAVNCITCLEAGSHL